MNSQKHQGRGVRRAGLASVILLAAAILAASGDAAWAQVEPRSDAGKPRDANGVYEESGFRLPLPRREDMDTAGQKVFDRLIAANNDPRRGASGAGKGLKGPIGIVLYSPRLAEISSDLNWYLRFESGLDDRTREVAILTVAREARSAFEWDSHEPLARRVGVPDAVIRTIRDGGDTRGLSARDAVIITLGRQAITDRRVSRETFDRALAEFGPKGLNDLVGLMGQYLSNAMLLEVFAMRTPAAAAAAGAER